MNTDLQNTNLLDSLHWRYATKKMNGQRVPAEKLRYILEAARMAPSSSGLQPYRILVISNRELLEKLRPIANDQSQITDCSELLVWAIQDQYTYEGIGDVFGQTLAERGLPATMMDDYKDRLWGMMKAMTSEAQQAHAAKQAYISLGLAIAAAAEQHVDATPMEGFDNAALDQALGLDKKGLKSAVILPLGYRDASNDWMVNFKKVRTPEEDFLIHLS